MLVPSYSQGRHLCDGSIISGENHILEVMVQSMVMIMEVMVQSMVMIMEVMVQTKPRDTIRLRLMDRLIHVGHEGHCLDCSLSDRRWLRGPQLKQDNGQGLSRVGGWSKATRTDNYRRRQESCIAAIGICAWRPL